VGAEPALLEESSSPCWRLLIDAQSLA
jgi:hypothetical protein